MLCCPSHLFCMTADFCLKVSLAGSKCMWKTTGKELQVPGTSGAMLYGEPESPIQEARRSQERQKAASLSAR